MISFALTNVSLRRNFNISRDEISKRAKSVYITVITITITLYDDVYEEKPLSPKKVM